MMSGILHIFPALSIAILTGVTAAQVQQPNSQNAGHALNPLDQAVEDIGPLSASLRSVQKDLRQPADFQDVYHVPGRDDLFMRSSGGLIAVFPQSAYIDAMGRSRRGSIPLIPAGTVFYIGLPEHFPGGPGVARPPHPSQVLTKIEPRMLSEPPGQPAAKSGSFPRTIVNDPNYRTSRVDEVLKQAAHAYAHRTSAPAHMTSETAAIGSTGD